MISLNRWWEKKIITLVHSSTFERMEMNRGGFGV